MKQFWTFFLFTIKFFIPSKIKIFYSKLFCYKHFAGKTDQIYLKKKKKNLFEFFSDIENLSRCLREGRRFVRPTTPLDFSRDFSIRKLFRFTRKVLKLIRQGRVVEFPLYDFQKEKNFFVVLQPLKTESQAYQSINLLISYTGKILIYINFWVESERFICDEVTPILPILPSRQRFTFDSFLVSSSYSNGARAMYFASFTAEKIIISFSTLKKK